MCLAIPGRIIRVSEPQDGTEPSPLGRLGVVDFGGVEKEVNLAFVPEATVGDYVVVHVGFAISTMDDSEAEEVFRYLREMEEADAADRAPDSSARSAAGSASTPQ